MTAARLAPPGEGLPSGRFPEVSQSRGLLAPQLLELGAPQSLLFIRERIVRRHLGQAGRIGGEFGERDQADALVLLDGRGPDETVREVLQPEVRIALPVIEVPGDAQLGE